MVGCRTTMTILLLLLLVVVAVVLLVVVVMGPSIPQSCCGLGTFAVEREKVHRWGARKFDWFLCEQADPPFDFVRPGDCSISGDKNGN